MPALIEVDNLVKHYQGVRAVDGISFTIPRGICLGLLGPNGAGKTTTIEILEGIKPATSGRISYKGEALGAQFRREAGIMFQSTALQEFITVRETLQMFRSLYEDGVAIEKLIQDYSLQDLLKVEIPASFLVVSVSVCYWRWRWSMILRSSFSMSQPPAWIRRRDVCFGSWCAISRRVARLC